MKRFLLIVLLSVSFTGKTNAADRLRLATTTSTENSGLLTELHPPFENKNGARVDVIAVGTGKALRLGENGDVDVVLVHAPEDETRFVADGYGVQRLPVMHNDFVLVGPPADPAGVRQADNITAAMRAIAQGQHTFISRGDESGTHKKEMELWRDAGKKPAAQSYLAVGQGMGAVLKIADDKLAYTLSDRGTYLAFKGKIELEILFSGDAGLFNAYHVILVNPLRHPHVQTELAEKYIEFLRGAEGQQIIREFNVDGEQLFFPDVIP